jgi:hypothetical protein
VWRERQTGRTKTLKGHYLLLISWEDVDPKIVVIARNSWGDARKGVRKKKGWL